MRHCRLSVPRFDLEESAGTGPAVEAAMAEAADEEVEEETPLSDR